MIAMEERLELAKKIDEAGDHLSEELQNQVFEFQQELIDSYATIADGLADAAVKLLESQRGTTAFAGDVKIPVEVYNGYSKLIENINRQLVELMHIRYGTQA